MSRITVTSDSLSHVSTQLTQGSFDIDSRLSQLNTLVHNLSDSEWSGSASSGFTELYTQFHQAGNDLKNALDGIAELLNRAARVYEETEASIAQSMRA